jgi:hypothetical protein
MAAMRMAPQARPDSTQPSAMTRPALLPSGLLESPQRSVAVPEEAGPARRSVLPDPAASLRPALARTQATTAEPALDVQDEPASTQQARPGRAGPGPVLGTADSRTGAQRERPADAFTTLRRVGDLPEHGMEPQPLQSLGLLAQPTQLSPKLMPFTQPGMQFLANAPDYTALAQRVLAAADAAQAGGDGLYEAKLELNPPQLGRMLASIAVRGEQVAIQLAVASPLPRRQLEEGLAGLKRSLEESGLEVAGLRIVSFDPETGGSSNGNPESGRDSTHEDNPHSNRLVSMPTTSDFLTTFLGLEPAA